MTAALTYAAVMALAAQCGGMTERDPIPLETLTRIVMHESGGNPEAWNMNRNGSTDCGLGQINSTNWAWLGLDAKSCKDPCRNLAAEAHILRSLSVYATGSPFKGFYLKPPGAQVSYVADMAASRFRAPAGITPPPAAPPTPRNITAVVLHSSVTHERR